MVISRVVIRNFRNIGFADVVLQPTVNVLVGANGSGKSSFISALRTALADDVSNRARRLFEEDFHRGCGPRSTTQVVVSVTFDGFGETAEDAALRLALSTADGPARLTYRFRPNNQARTALKDGKDPQELTIEDYGVERTVGGRFDPATIEWDEDAGGVLSEQLFQRYTIVEVQALRDVVQDLRRQRSSPLARLLETVEIPNDTRQQLEAAMSTVRDAVRGTEGLRGLGEQLENAYHALAGNPTSLKVTLGLGVASLSSILRELSVLVTDDQLYEYELSRNGLGFNNLLYIAMLIEIFRRRSAKGAGSELLLIEEPEAHLHPQPQEALLQTLSAQSFQTVVTTHSSHVIVAARLNSIITMDRAAESKAQRLVHSAGLSLRDVYDLERYLDSNRGALLFAKGVVLVEGPAEQIVVPLYAYNLGIDLSRLGIQVVAVNGVHFAAYTKLLGDGGIKRPYVVLTDGDQFREAGKAVARYDDGTNTSSDPLVFKNRTTFEYAMTSMHSLHALTATAQELKRKRLEDTIAAVTLAGRFSTDDIADVQVAVLKAAADVGKHRFAQAFGRQVTILGIAPPSYIADALRGICARVEAAITDASVTERGTT